MYKKIVSWILFIIWLLFIFYMSSNNSESSSNMSNEVLYFINNIFNINISSFFIRKLAHFMEYFILGILTTNLFKQYNYLDKKHLFYIILICVLYAISDEFHQLFVSGRTGKIFDVCIDSCGSILSIFIYYFIYKKKVEN